MLAAHFSNRQIKTILEFKIIFVNSQIKGKLEPQSVKCIFLGYANNQREYRCYHPLTRKFFTSMDITFHESEPYLKIIHLATKFTFYILHWWSYRLFNSVILKKFVEPISVAEKTDPFPKIQRFDLVYYSRRESKAQHKTKIGIRP